MSTNSKIQGGLSLHQQSPPFWTVVDKTDNHRSEDRYVKCYSSKSELALLDSMMKYTPPRCMQGNRYEIKLSCNSLKYKEEISLIRDNDSH